MSKHGRVCFVDIETVARPMTEAEAAEIARLESLQTPEQFAAEFRAGYISENQQPAFARGILDKEAEMAIYTIITRPRTSGAGHDLAVRFRARTGGRRIVDGRKKWHGSAARAYCYECQR